VSSTDIPEQEERLLAHVRGHLERNAAERPAAVTPPDYDKQLLELRDEIAQARLEDVPALLAQMERISGLAVRRAESEATQPPPVDPSAPYFAHVRLREGGRERDVLIGRTTHVDARDGVRIVDWRHAPISQLYYRYPEGASYEETFGGREVHGEVMVRRTVTIVDGELVRVQAPQGVYVRRKGEGAPWRELELKHLELAGGQDKAMRPANVARGIMGVGSDGQQRADRHLPEIAALLDARQFELISAADSGVVVIQGGAGSGKTTIGLHRVAYLAFRDPARFKPEKILVVTYGVALGAYISEVLPALGVHGVRVDTYARWADALRREAFPWLPAEVEDDTPPAVSRLKKHPALLRLLTRRAREQARKPGAARGPRAAVQLWAEVLTDLPALRAAMAAGDEAAPIAGADLVAAHRWCTARCVALLETDPHEQNEAPEAPAENEGEGGSSAWDAARSGERDEAPAPRVRPKGRRAAARDDDGDDNDDDDSDDGQGLGADGRDLDDDLKPRLDREDDALLLRLHQLLAGPLRARKQPLVYEHVFVDEAQDLSPVELAVLLDTVSGGRSVTLAGDTSQKLYLDNGFRDWRTTLGELGLSTTEVEPLRIAYRSTREVLEVAREILGPIADPVPPVATRSGAPVEAHLFPQAGAAVAFLAEALRPLFAREPRATVGVLARFAEQADAYYEGLCRAEVPYVRRVRAQDFTFRPGIDVTEIAQVKGLEFDYVVLVDVNASVFPETDEARHLLHIGATRAAHQLWLFVTGKPSSLVPKRLLDL
jgi:ATP-dependent DNA helicase UvrD/PcrA